MFKKLFGLLDENAGDEGAAAAGASGNNDAASTGDQGAAVADKGAQSSVDTSKQNDKPAQIWPDDWRKHIAGEDEKELQRLGRFATPADVHKAYRALEARLSSGQLKSALPQNAKPEELAQWRKENGIPEAPDKYELKLANNMTVGDEDKPFVDEFLKVAHSLNMSPDQASAAVQTYFDNRARQAEMTAEKDESDRQAALDALNVEYGKEFRTNVNMVRATLERFPSGIREALESARLPDGTALFNNPDVIRGFVTMAREIDPAATLVPSVQGDPVKAIQTEKAEIEKVMSTNRKAYNKDEKMQARYRELIDAELKLNQRKAA